MENFIVPIVLVLLIVVIILFYRNKKAAITKMNNIKNILIQDGYRFDHSFDAGNGFIGLDSLKKELVIINSQIDKIEKIPFSEIICAESSAVSKSNLFLKITRNNTMIPSSKLMFYDANKGFVKYAVAINELETWTDRINILARQN